MALRKHLGWREQRPTEEKSLGDEGNRASGDVGGARRQREEPAFVTWVVGVLGDALHRSLCSSQDLREKPVTTT